LTKEQTLNLVIQSLNLVNDDVRSLDESTRDSVFLDIGYKYPSVSSQELHPLAVEQT
jgi:hypothetical protein